MLGAAGCGSQRALLTRRGFAGAGACSRADASALLEGASCWLLAVSLAAPGERLRAPGDEARGVVPASEPPGTLAIRLEMAAPSASLKEED